MALLPWALLCVALRHVEANWEIGGLGESCDTVCGSGTCSQDGNRQLNSNFEFDYVFEDLVTRGLIPAEYSQCDRYSSLTDAALQAQPGTLYFVDTLAPVCYQYSEESTCAGSAGGIMRICCCLPNPTDDPATACFVPTTTTSTATTQTTTSLTTWTTSTTKTATTSTTLSTTSSTKTTTSISTSSTTTSTTTTTTATTSTSTGTMVTTTSSTETTIITESSTSMTTSSSTGTTVTTTSSITSTTVVTSTSTTSTTSSSTSTTTVTEGAQTQITAFVPAGSSDIPIADRTGFSEGDVILLRGREVVEIDNITEDGGRRLDGDGRRLSGAVPATLEVFPPIGSDYNPGDSLSNLGPSSTYTGSDPITFHNGQKIKFWLQSNQEFMILETADLKVFGEVFPGPKSDLQWFGRFRVVLPDDAPVVEVNIKRPSNYTRVSSCSSRRMDSMDVYLGESTSPLREVLRHPMQFTAGDQVQFKIDCRQQDRPLLASSRTEYMHFETPSIAFLIVAAHAGNEFPDDWRLQLKYMHLDLVILEMPRKNEFKGILPEIWGLLPRSPEVEAMLSPPQADEIEQCCPGCCNA